MSVRVSLSSNTNHPNRIKMKESLTQCAHIFGRGESTQANKDTQREIELPVPTSCPLTISQKNQNITVVCLVMWTSQCKYRLYEFTYWLVRGYYTRWWEDQAGLVGTGSPTCVERSTSRWAQESRWGGGLALGCLCPPWWQKSTLSHKTDLKEKPP